MIFNIDADNNQEGTHFEFSANNSGAQSGRTRLMVIHEDGRIGIGELEPGAKLAVSGGMAVRSSYYTTGVRAGNVIISGNVGIGTTSPSRKLFVNWLDDFKENVPFTRMHEFIEKK
ncbi:MAG: hypothetical protein ACMUIP_17795 [bacterium]